MEKTDTIKLLAIDDKPDNLTALTAVAQDVFPWARVLTATNGSAGIELAAAEDPDVILLDIVMPGMDGFEVCRLLKADDRLKDIPVVFLTALKTDVVSRVKALEAGAEGFLAKPLETVELTAQIRAMTKVKAANRSQRKDKNRLEALVAERTLSLEMELAERKRAEAEIIQLNTELVNKHNDVLLAQQASESLLDRLKIATRAAHIGIWDRNIVDDNLLWNDMIYDIYGVPRGAFKGGVMEWIEYIHPDDRSRVLSDLESAMRGEKEYAPEFRIIRPDGSIRDIKANAQAFFDNGKPVRMVGTNIDITARKQAESELRRLSAAIEQSPETVVITDTAGTIQYVNTAFEKTTGYTCEEAIGQNPRILKSGCQDAGFYKAMWNTLLDGRVWEGRMVNKRKDGSLYTEEASIAPVKEPNGTITNYVGVKRDITLELRSEEMFRQAQKMESVGRLAGGVAHDFNNLLMGILGYAELCREELPVDHPVREWVDEITKEAHRSANLTRQLLAFARRQTVAPKVVDLNDVVGNMLKMLRRLIGEDIDLVWQPGAEPWSVKIDPGQVDQILANLCVNARDAIGGAGKITIETDNVLIDADYCTIHVEAAPGSYVMLAVSDDGCGMDHETLANVFEPFFTTKPTGEGTGLGLATVYGIVKQNSGFINVYSEPGKGTTFRIYLPRDTSVSNAPTDSATKAVIQGGTETILLVEDETAVRITIRMCLERFGYNVIAAESPAVALRLAAEHRDGIDLLLTDVVMPGMSGRELAGKLAVDRPSMKILYISGYTADVIAHRGILEDGVQFLSKPVGRDVLAQKVRDVLGCAKRENKGGNL